MKEYLYDLHLHSCLSPCGGDDATPSALAGMAKLAGFDLVALTDHNSCQNCPAFFEACHAYGVIPVAGMELTTAEEIHLVCLFPDLESALSFEQKVKNHRLEVANRPELFGNQRCVDAEDNLLFEDPYLLSIATTLSLEQAFDLVHACEGACFPAHIDRESGGIIAILGTLPESPSFCAVEFKNPEAIDKYRASYPLPDLILCDSDSHYLEQLPDAFRKISLFGESEDEIRRSLIRLLNTGAAS